MKALYAMLIRVFFCVFPISALAGGVGGPWDKLIDQPSRFVVLHDYNDEAVLDKETGLVWEKSPGSTAMVWGGAQFHCNHKALGNRKGWRVPAAQELASLIDPSVPRPGPTLPAGHPFTNVQQNDYWSGTLQDLNPNGNAWGVSFLDAFVVNFPKAFPLFVWCVRGGQGADFQ